MPGLFGLHDAMRLIWNNVIVRMTDDQHGEIVQYVPVGNYCLRCNLGYFYIRVQASSQSKGISSFVRTAEGPAWPRSTQS